MLLNTFMLQSQKRDTYEQVTAVKRNGASTVSQNIKTNVTTDSS